MWKILNAPKKKSQGMPQIRRLPLHSLFISSSNVLITKFKYLCFSIIISGVAVWSPQIDRKIPGVKYGCLYSTLWKHSYWLNWFISKWNEHSFLTDTPRLPMIKELATEPHKAPFPKGSGLTAALHSKRRGGWPPTQVYTDGWVQDASR